MPCTLSMPSFNSALAVLQVGHFIEQLPSERVITSTAQCTFPGLKIKKGIGGSTIGNSLFTVVQALLMLFIISSGIVLHVPCQCRTDRERFGKRQERKLRVR